MRDAVCVASAGTSDARGPSSESFVVAFHFVHQFADRVGFPAS